MKYSSSTQNFFQDVYDVVVHIPEGRVTSYGAVARYLGGRGSARMVGWAMNACMSDPRNIPAHRVLNREGLLTGKMHFATPLLMQERLEAEGVVVKNDQVIDFKKLFWDPMEELGFGD